MGGLHKMEVIWVKRDIVEFNIKYHNAAIARERYVSNLTVKYLKINL